MARNRFEQVNQVQPDAITLVLKRDNIGASGSILLPAAASGGRLATDQVSPHLPAQDAFRGAVRLANDLRLRSWGAIQMASGSPIGASFIRRSTNSLSDTMGNYCCRMEIRQW